MTTRTAYSNFDRYLPEDNRTDAEIERDAAERRRDRRLAAVRAAYAARAVAGTKPTPKHPTDEFLTVG